MVASSTSAFHCFALMRAVICVWWKKYFVPWRSTIYPNEVLHPGWRPKLCVCVVVAFASRWNATAGSSGWTVVTMLELSVATIQQRTRYAPCWWLFKKPSRLGVKWFIRPSKSQCVTLTTNKRQLRSPVNFALRPQSTCHDDLFVWNHFVIISKLNQMCVLNPVFRFRALCAAMLAYLGKMIFVMFSIPHWRQGVC